MKPEILNHFNSILHHLYINPLEKCNLACKICYTKKTDPVLTEKEILDFVERYHKEIELKVITFCGGEVFALPYFPRLTNTLIEKGIFIQVITNGTIDRLSEFTVPNCVDLIVSIDGLEQYHDKNRGKGNFAKSIAFLKKARGLGFHTEIFSVVTRQNLSMINRFEDYLNDRFGLIDVTYHPRKLLSYLNVHPSSNKEGQRDGFEFLTDEEYKNLMEMKNVFPPKKLGCYQIALASDGTVYGCCEGYEALGKMNEPIKQLFRKLKASVGGPCLGCSQPGFMCGLAGIMKDVLAV